MSKIETYKRYFLIINKLKRPASFEEIALHLDNQSGYQDLNFRISKRTFQRDINDIRELFDFDIKFQNDRYFIENKDENPRNERMLEAFNTFNTLNLTNSLTTHIHFEQRKPLGSENLYGLLHVIQKQELIKIKYLKFGEDLITERELEPYALKEFKNRWYLMAIDKKDNTLKSFAFDRIKDVIFLNKKFQKTLPFDIDAHFKYSFGIISPNDQKLEEVILSFTPFQGKYIKTLPLHHTQEILIDDKKELRVKLQLYVTHDFKMELLSLGDEVKVLQPESLIQEMKETLKKALGRYKS